MHRSSDHISCAMAGVNSESTHSNKPDTLPVITIARSYTDWIGGLVFALVSSTIPSMTFSGSCLGWSHR